MTKTLLKTGEVATVLDVSRQHVVDLCDRHDLPFVWIGKHRRVPRQAVEEFLGKRNLTREQERSLWLHRALLVHLVTDPDGSLDRARDNIRRWKSEHRPDGMTAHYLSEWAKILDCGLDEVVEVLVSTTPRAVELRQNSPFAGVLPDETRVRVLKAFNDHWRRDHGDRNEPTAA